MPSYSVDSIVNTSIVSDISPSLSISVDSITNTNNIPNPSVTVIVKPTSIVNASIVSDSFAIIAPTLVQVNSIVNTSQISNIAINGRITLDSIVNESIIPTINVQYPRTVQVNSIKNFNSFGEVIVVNQEITTIERPDTNFSRNLTQKLAFSEKDSDGIFGKNKTYSYQDISQTFKPHPITGDLIKVLDVHAINQSLRNILLTDRYERPCSNLLFGAGLKRKLFDLMTTGTDQDIKDVIEDAIKNHEPRIVLRQIDVEQYTDSYAINISIIYSIRKTNKTGTFTAFLEKV